MVTTDDMPPAGREMDVLVAEALGVDGADTPGFGSPSRHVGDAMQALEAWRAQHPGSMWLLSAAGRNARCTIIAAKTTRPNEFEADAPTPAYAICKVIVLASREAAS